MSLNYRDNSGIEMPVAGLNGLSGTLVYGASTIKTGTITFPSIPGANSSATMEVVFDEPMPDNDYLVSFECADARFIFSVATGKTSAGFAFYAMNATDAAPSAMPAVTWTAFKLYTVENVADLENTVNGMQENGIIPIQRNNSVNDCNNAIPPKSGMAIWYGTTTSTVNSPAGKYGSIIALRTGTTIKQIWTQNGGNLEYVRSIECDSSGNYSSINSAWRKILTETDVSSPTTHIFHATASSFPSVIVILSNSTSGIIEFEQTMRNSAITGIFATIKGFWDITKSTVTITETSGSSTISASAGTDSNTGLPCIKLSVGWSYGDGNNYKFTKAQGFNGASVDSITTR